MQPVLNIKQLDVKFIHPTGVVHAVRQLTLALASGTCLGVVGESGSGKTQAFMAVMGLLEKNAWVQGRVEFEGREILGASPKTLNQIRGSKLTMVFQDPMSSLTPHLTIGAQMAEVLVVHQHDSWCNAKHAALQMLDRVRVPEAARRLTSYPHELSGGMRQRVMIGMSLLCNPSLLIADEPTTALDVTVQAQIIELLKEMRAELGLSLVLISHDLAVVLGLADRIVVMYAGRIVEQASGSDIFQHAQHPYTVGLLKCTPDLATPRLDRLPTLQGFPPDLTRELRGCDFAPRCSRVSEICHTVRPELRIKSVARGGVGAVSEVHEVACHNPYET